MWVIFPWPVSASSSGGSAYPIELLEVSGNGNIDGMRRVLSVLEPDVLLFSTKKLERNLIAELEQIRADCPRIGLALFLGSYNAEDVELLRGLAVRGEGGMALFLKQSLDLAEQFCNIIMAVSQRQVVLDPELTALLFAEKPVYPFLRQLTGREAEILELVSKGYTNFAIAEGLYIDVKTVEHHINSMYSKLKAAADFNDKHPRVSAARLYLEATGKLLNSAAAGRQLAFSSPVSVGH